MGMLLRLRRSASVYFLLVYLLSSFLPGVAFSSKRKGNATGAVSALSSVSRGSGKKRGLHGGEVASDSAVSANDKFSLAGLLKKKGDFDRRTWSKYGFITRTYGSLGVGGSMPFLLNSDGGGVFYLAADLSFAIGQEFIIKVPSTSLFSLYGAVEFSDRLFMTGAAPRNGVNYHGHHYNLAKGPKFNYFDNFGLDFKFGFLVNKNSGALSKYGFYVYTGLRFNATSPLYGAFPSDSIVPVPTVGLGSMLFFKAVPDDRLRMTIDIFVDPYQPIDFDFRFWNDSISPGLSNMLMIGLRASVQYSF